MKRRRIRRNVLAGWMLVGTLATVVGVFLVAFVWRMMHPPVTPYVETELGAPTVIQCEIVNASGMNGVGRRALSYLRERGFDVVELSTSPTVQTSSVVLDRLGDRRSCVKLAHVLGIADTLVEPRIDSMLFVRASVILGQDISLLAPFAE